MVEDIPYKHYTDEILYAPRDKRERGNACWTFISADKDFFSCAKQIFLRCPNCCMWSHLFAHKVDIDGVVHPSIWCQCIKTANFELRSKDWHIWGRLLGWKELIGVEKKVNSDL